MKRWQIIVLASVFILGAAEGLGTLGRKGVGGAGGAVQGVGSAVKRLFGGEKK